MLQQLFVVEYSNFNDYCVSESAVANDYNRRPQETFGFHLEEMTSFAMKQMAYNNMHDCITITGIIVKIVKVESMFFQAKGLSCWSFEL